MARSTEERSKGRVLCSSSLIINREDCCEIQQVVKQPSAPMVADQRELGSQGLSLNDATPLRWRLIASFGCTGTPIQQKSDTPRRLGGHCLAANHQRLVVLLQMQMQMQSLIRQQKHRAHLSFSPQPAVV